jgi:hypothetical protein
MNDQDKTKETLLRELDELRQRVRLLEDMISEQQSDFKHHAEPNAQQFPGKEVWRLPGYWH